MLLSVIVPVYNVEKYITQCIESISRQTYQNLEILIVVDGATDNSGKICDELSLKDNRIQVIYRENGGLSAARNTGLLHATGNYITFVDGDDWIEPDMYETMMKYAAEQKADLVACRYKCIYTDHVEDDSTGQVTVYNQRYEMLTQCLEEEECFLIQNAAWNKLYSREVLGDEKFPEGKWYEDVVFSAKILSRVRRGVYIDTAFYNYVRERQGSIMNAGITERIFTDQIPAFLEKEEYLKTLDSQEPLRAFQYNFYKKMLILYRQLFKHENKQLRRYAKGIITIIRSRKNTFSAVSKVSIAKKSDIIKLRIFVLSPTLFRVVMQINDRCILPHKVNKIR